LSNAPRGPKDFKRADNKRVVGAERGGYDEVETKKHIE